MLLSEIIIRRHIRRILAEDVGREGGVPTSTAVDTSGKSTLTGTAGGKRTLADKIALGFLALPTAMKLKDLFFGDDDSDPGLRDAKKQFKAAVCGDSQAQGPLGQETERRLAAEGYTVVRADGTTYKAGAKPEAVLNFVKANAKDSILIVAIFGGNGSPDTAKAAAEAMQKVCDENLTTLLVIGPPVTTKITDAKFIPKAGTADYYINLPPADSKSPAYRKLISDSMQTADVDGRAVKVYGIASQYNGYPEQPDGLHCYNGAGGVIDAAMTFFGLAAITASLKKVIQGQGQGKTRTKVVKRKRIVTDSGDTLDDVQSVGMASVDSSATINPSRFKQGLEIVESGAAGYRARNKSTGALGKYQFIPSWFTQKLITLIKDKVGYNNFSASKAQEAQSELDAELLNHSGKKSPEHDAAAVVYPKKGKVYEMWEAFYTNDQMQEDLMDIQIIDIGKVAERYKKAYATDPAVSALSIPQIAACIHFMGSGDFLKKFIEGKQYGPPTSENSAVPVYISGFSQGYYGSDY